MTERKQESAEPPVAEAVITEWITEGSEPYISLTSLLDLLTLAAGTTPDKKSGFLVIRGTLLELWYRHVEDRGTREAKAMREITIKDRLAVVELADRLRARHRSGAADALIDAVRCCGEFPECSHVLEGTTP